MTMTIGHTLPKPGRILTSSGGAWPVVNHLPGNLVCRTTVLMVTYRCYL